MLGSSEMYVFVLCDLSVLVRDDLRVGVIWLTKCRKSASKREGNKVVIWNREVTGVGNLWNT